jgi:hypothetical protein
MTMYPCPLRRGRGAVGVLEQTWEADPRLLPGSRGANANGDWLLRSQSPQLDDHEVPDLLRVVDGFPPAGSGMPKPRTAAQVGGLELSAT